MEADIVVVNHHLLLADTVLKEEGFGELLPAYQSEPSVLKNQLTQDTIQRIWSSPSVSAWYVPANQKLYLDLGDEYIRLE